MDQAPLLLAVFDDAVAEQTPQQANLSPDAVMARAGQVVMRSGWDARAVQVTLLCEHGKAAGWGQNRWGDFLEGLAGHEHPDPGSFELHAFGEALIIDSGYMGWPDHDLVNRPENHNIVLVDGKGPQIYRMVLPEVEYDGAEVKLLKPEQEGGYGPAADGMAYLLSRDVDTAGVKLAEVATRYTVHVPDTEVVRRAVLLDDAALVVHDRVRTVGRGGARHTYTFQLHGHGGQDSGGTFSSVANGGLWTRPNARVRAVVGADRSPPTLTRRTAPHDPGNRRPKAHTVLDATVEAAAGAPVEFVAVLVPEPNISGAYTTVPLKLTQGEPGVTVRWDHGGAACRAWTGELHTVRGGNGQALLSALSGAYCVKKTSVFGYFLGSSSDPDPLLTARFSLDNSGAVERFRVTVHRATGAAVLDLPKVAGQYVQGHCRHEALHSRWRIVAHAPTVVTTGTAPEPLVPNLVLVGRPRNRPTVPLGQKIHLSAADTCGPLAPGARYSWDLLARPELSKVALKDTETSNEIRFLPDLPGLYRVEVTVRSLGHTRRAALDVEVEGEPPWPNSASADAGVSDAAVADAATPDAGTTSNLGGGGCGGCAVTKTRQVPVFIAFFSVFFLGYWLRRRGR